MWRKECERQRNELRAVTERVWASCSVMPTLRAHVHCVYSTSLILNTHPHITFMLCTQAPSLQTLYMFFYLLVVVLVFFRIPWWHNFSSTQTVGYRTTQWARVFIHATEDINQRDLLDVGWIQTPSFLSCCAAQWKWLHSNCILRGSEKGSCPIFSVCEQWNVEHSNV